VSIFDASALIGHLDADDPHSAASRRVIDATADQPLRASPLTIAEVLVGPARRGELERAQSVLARLGLVEIPLPGDAAVRLASLRAATCLKLPDCCVLLAAEQVAEPVVTFDAALRDAAAARGIATLG
jgi:predicted nucleic acid-binding protein